MVKGRQLEQTLIEQGQVRFVYRHYAFLGQESAWAAEATECAADQQRFWAFHNRVFELQVRRHDVGNFSKVKLDDIAPRSAEWRRIESLPGNGPLCVVRCAVGRSTQQRGVTRTPTLLVDGHSIATPAKFEDLRTLLIEAR